MSGQDAERPLASIAHRVAIACVMDTLDQVRRTSRTTTCSVLLVMSTTIGQGLEIITQRAIAMTRRSRRTIHASTVWLTAVVMSQM